MNISIVVPVHNEENYLPYSIPSLLKLRDKVHEYIFVLDNCGDNSIYYIRRYFPDTKILFLNRHRWRYYAAESFQYGFDHADGDVILAAGADLIIDMDIPDIINKVFQDSTVGSICFRYLNYDLYSFTRRLHGFYENIYKNIAQRFRKAARHTGFYAFRRSLMFEIGGLKDIVSEYDEFSRRVKKHGYKVVYIPYTRTLHLRPGLTNNKQFIQGAARNTLPQYNILNTLFHSIVHLKPYLFTGFLYGRNGFLVAGSLGHDKGEKEGGSSYQPLLNASNSFNRASPLLSKPKIKGDS